MEPNVENDAPMFDCQSCGKQVTDDGADALLGWLRDQDGELSFCADCGPTLAPPPPEIMGRFHAGAAIYAEFKGLLHAHREDALVCLDHPEHYCCTCGEHMTLGYHEHLAAVLTKREQTRTLPVALPTPGTPQNPVDGATHPCPTPGYAGRHTAVGAGAISSPYVCHGCQTWFVLPGETP